MMLMGGDDFEIVGISRNVIVIMAINEYIQLVMNAVFTGLGVAIGTYFAQKHFITKFERLMRLLKPKKK